MSVDAIWLQSDVVRSEITFFKYIKTNVLLLAVLASIMMVEATVVVAEHRINVTALDGLIQKSRPVNQATTIAYVTAYAWPRLISTIEVELVNPDTLTG
ncbi:hypothetical protein GCM10007082_11560 [Oceanisphaera arctica]|nr:hypothetical protein GCM10007082_11560 [Oceanisphaera arctica]